MQIGPYVLRYCQERAVELLRAAIARCLATGVPARILCVGPCGVGKTIISSVIMKLALDKQKSCGFLASGRLLISQKSRKLKECGIRHGILMAGRDDQMAGYHNLREYYGDKATCIVASKDTYWSRAFERDRVDKMDIQLLCIDEAHLGLGPSWIAILNVHGAIVVIGFTATPAKGNGLGLGKFYNELVVVATHEELLRESLLVPCRVFAPYMPDLSDLKVGSETGDYVLDKIQQRFDNQELIGDVIRDWKKWGDDRPTACFASGVQHSIHLRDEFIKNGIPAAHIDADTPDEERERYYAQIEDGSLKILCNFGVLVQGFDLPKLSCGILAFATGSVVKYLQVCGRMFRPYPGKPDAILIDHGGNVHKHGWPQEDREWKLDPEQSVQERDAKRREAAGKPNNPICCPKCQTVREYGSSCPNCGFRRERTGLKIRMVDGTLKEIREKAVKKRPVGLQKIWTQALGQCANSGRTGIQARIIFKAKTGQWPADDLPYQIREHQLRMKVADVYPGFCRRKKQEIEP